MNELDYIANVLFAQERRLSGYTPVKWIYVKDNLKNKFRRDAKRTVKKWSAEQTRNQKWIKSFDKAKICRE